MQNSALKNSPSERNHSKPEFKFHTYGNVPKIGHVVPGVGSDQNRRGYSGAVQLQVQGVVRAGERAKGFREQKGRALGSYRGTSYWQGPALSQGVAALV